MAADVKSYPDESMSYNNGLLQVLKQHRIIIPEEEDELQSYLHDTSF
ncbi:hypothetical protein JW826_04855 [Candidatus Woesearchaeota archaeon]|nr:hypothetical protein [Candidatus Woesearchaeota archaeon]